MTPQVTVATLARLVGGRVLGDGAQQVHGVAHDSRAVRPGDLFVAVCGDNVDGSKFAADAVRRGAVAIVSETDLALDVPQIVVDDARNVLPTVAEETFGRPTHSLQVVGITGTNGKTTVAWLIESVIAACGGRPALMGTVLFRGPRSSLPAQHTTPEGDDISRFARTVLDEGATHLVMEVSSHGLALSRVEAVDFDIAVFTNLTQDHLDFHGDLEAYGAAKARLFLELQPAHAVINVDDAFGAALASRIRIPLYRCSTTAGPHVEIGVREWEMDRSGIRATVVTPAGEGKLRSPLIGAHNLENLLVATGCGLALGYGLATVLEGLADAKGAPGRLERVEHDGDVAVLVDYAHTPDALGRALAALRPVTPGRLIAVFGCGGDRDRGKRAQMGEQAARTADLCVVTNDNPRTEDPDAIIAQILPGVAAAGVPEIEVAQLGDATSGFVKLTDRASAIDLALRAARAGDTVLIAGKGHEDYQIIGTEKRHFDDREVARATIGRLAREA